MIKKPDMSVIRGFPWNLFSEIRFFLFSKRRVKIIVNSTRDRAISGYLSGYSILEIA